MLQFWKKPSQKEKSPSSNLPPNVSPTRQPSPGLDHKFKCSTVESTRSALLASFEEEGFFDIGENDSQKEQSRLSKTVSEVLSDKSALAYFVQYLETRSGVPYIQCWLDINSFQTALQTCGHLKKDDSNSNHLSPLPSTKVEHDSLSVSTDCDSYTADSNSLCEYSASTISEPKSHPDTKPSVKHEKTRVELSNNTCDSNTSDISPKNNSCKNDVKSICTDNDKSKILQEFTDDALSIFKKYIALEAPEAIKCPEEIRKEVIENICTTDKLLSSNCFEKVQKYVYQVLDKEYFESFLGSDYFCKYQIDILTSGNVVLEDILYNETALFYFMEYLEQENNRPLLDFWLAASNFQQQLNDQKEFFDPIEAQNDAVVLYDKYFSLQAHCPLGFGDKVRFAVEQNICGENGLMMDCFHLPLKIIEQVLETNFLKTFLASQLFYKYLSELINTVQCNGYSNLYERNRYQPSDCSSEKSFSTNNTFLAMENPTRKVKKEKGTDMNIDTRQLYDPDSLWKRKKHHRLSFGRVTELGRFETDVEPEPDKKTESKLKNVVKKFVNIEEDKHKEEMAWQVAEMIVKDITSVTLNNTSLQHS